MIGRQFGCARWVRSGTDFDGKPSSPTMAVQDQQSEFWLVESTNKTIARTTTRLPNSAKVGGLSMKPYREIDRKALPRLANERES